MRTFTTYAVINEHDVLADSTLIIEQGMIDISSDSATMPDPKWTHVDPSGHFHAFSGDPFAGDNDLPTLDVITSEIEHTEEGDLDREWTETVSVWQCKICRAPVEPRWIPDQSARNKQMPGPLSWRVEASAVGPGTMIMLGLVGSVVSVRSRSIELGCEWFGGGTLITHQIERRHDYHKWSGSVQGHGALGARKL